MASGGETKGAAGGSTSGTSLMYHHLFGLNVAVTPSVLHVDDTTVAYVSGHNVVVSNTDSQRQRIISGLESTKAITAIALSPRKNLLAVAERADRAVVSIYDVHSGRRKKQLTTSEISSTEIVCVNFSDHKTIVTQGGAPDWTLVVWSYDKGKVVATGRVSNQANSPISHVSFCPSDASTLCVTGDTIIRLLRIQDGTLKALNPNLSKREPQNYLAHAWLPEERVVASTDNGDLLIFENAELKVQMSTGDDGGVVTAIAAYTKGFICGGEGGIVRVFDRSDDGRDPYKLAMTLELSPEATQARICSVSVSPDEESNSNMVLTTDSNQMYVAQLASLDIIKSEENVFTKLGTALHGPSLSGSLAVVGMDVCLRKPLIVTCGVDKTVRVWNYLDRSMDLVRVFDEEPTSCAFHPSGLHVLVGFTDKLRLMNLLMEEIQPCREFSVKSCVDCCFSEGGHMFAATTGNAINVYNYYTFECIAQLRGHNQKVMRVQFLGGERSLLSAGMDGSVIRWDYLEGRRSGEFNQKGVVYTSALPTADRKIIASGTDRLIRVINYNEDGVGESAVELDSNIQLGRLCMTSSGRSLFAAGTDQGRPGVVRVYNYPLNGNFIEYQAHSGPVARMRLTADDQYLFTVGSDGMLAAFAVREPVSTKASRAGPGAGGRGAGKQERLPFAEETLVSKRALEEKKQIMGELHAKVDELQLHNEYQLRRKDIKYAEKIQEVTEKFTQELEAGRQKYNLLAEEKEDMRLEYTYKVESLEAKQTKEIEEMQRNYNSKIQAEVTRYNELEEERVRLQHDWDEKNDMVVESHEQYIQDLTEGYENKLHTEEEERQRIGEQKEILIRGFHEQKTSVEEDADTEIEVLKRKYELKLAAEKEATLRLKGENGIMRKKYQALNQDILDQKEEIKSLLEKQQQLYEKIKGLEKDIQGHKKEINEREETIQDKEKRIYDLKKKNQELEKFKFVLDYKIKELKRQIEPRENEIADMAQQIKEMDQELEQYHKSNAALDLMIGELRLKMEGMEQEIQQQKAVINEGEALMARITSDLEDMHQGRASHKTLKSSVTRLYKKYVQDDLAMNSRSGDVDVQFEYNRQREYLEKSVESLKRKLAKDMELHRNENMRLMREGVQLTREINDLRRELHVAKALRGKLAVRAVEPPSDPVVANRPPRPPRSSNSRREAWGSRSSRMSSSEAQREVEIQQQQLHRLRTHIARMEDAVGGPLATHPQFDRSEYM